MKQCKNDPCNCGSGKKFKHCCEGKAAAPPHDAYSQLVALYNARRYAEVESRARLLIDKYPPSGFSWKLLGAALQMQGKPAQDAFQKAAFLMPNDAEAHFNLGVVQKGNGLLEEAVISFRRVLKIRPDFADAHNNLGTALKELGQLDQAVTCYRRAVELKPDFAYAHFALGTILKDLAQFEEAAACYRRVVKLKPDSVEAYCNLGLLLQKLGQFEDAVSSSRRALEIKPDLAEAHGNLGLSLQSLGQLNAAAASCRRALELKPDLIEAHINLGNILKELGQINDAVECYRKVLEIKPDHAETWTNLLFTLSYSACITTAQYLNEARQYGRMVTEKAGIRFNAWQCTPSPERLRVGLISGDLRSHSVGYFLDGLLPHIEADRIELIAYPTYLKDKEDELTARIKPYFAEWKPLTGLSDAEAARLIHADGVHVLLDLSGHTGHNRLPVLAWKPAPVQATWLGLPNTTGVQEMDYVLGDAVAIPPEHEYQLSEKVWRLPDCYVCFSAPRYPIEVAPLPSLATGQLTFGSFNNLTKMNDAVVELWARVLLSVPNSRLYLKSAQLNDAEFREQTLQRFAVRGVDRERVLLGRTLGSIAEHLAEYHRVDIALDTFPYTGTTTNVEALWMGVPVLSLQGDRFLSLSAKSIAHYAGLPEWVALDKDDYVAKAVAFTADLQHLATLRTGLRQQVLASPVFDAPRFARNLEEALWGMWRAWSKSAVKNRCGA